MKSKLIIEENRWIWVRTHDNDYQRQAAVLPAIEIREVLMSWSSESNIFNNQVKCMDSLISKPKRRLVILLPSALTSPPIG